MTSNPTFRAAREAAAELEQLHCDCYCWDRPNEEKTASLISERFRKLVEAAEGVRLFAWLGSPEAEKAWSALRDALKEVL